MATITTASPLALITGGIRGIGLAIAELLYEKGYSLILTGTRVSFDPASLPFDSNRVIYKAVDFSKDDQTSVFIKYLSSLGKLDVCVNNAGINIIEHVFDVTADNFDLVQKINVQAPYLISQVVAKVMAPNKYGRIVNIASIWSVNSKRGRSSYCTSKAAIVGMTRSLATDLAEHNILVNCISPGFTLTDLTRESLSREEMKTLSAQVPLNRMGKPSEIAEVAWFMCSPKNSYMTGQNIVVDGGFTNV